MGNTHVTRRLIGSNPERVVPATLEYNPFRVGGVVAAFGGCYPPLLNFALSGLFRLALKPALPRFRLSGADLALRGATLKAGGATLKPRGEALKARGEALKAGGVTLKAGGVTLKAGGATLKARGATLKARGATLKA